MKTYQELITIPDFMGRYNYLKCTKRIGEETFGFDRWLNQKFYRSPEWKRIRNIVIEINIPIFINLIFLITFILL